MKKANKKTETIFQENIHTVAFDRAERLKNHQKVIATLVSLEFATASSPLNIFADGDSWFDYPLPFLEPADVITEIGNSGAPRPVILNMAHHGDPAISVMGVTQRLRMIEALADPRNGRFDAILISAGGNDIAGEQFCLWLNQYQPGYAPADGLDMARLRHILGVIESACIDLIEVRDELPGYTPQNKPVIFMHGYDFPLPNGKGVCGAGPWLKPSLEYRKWVNSTDAVAIVKLIMIEFDRLLQGIEQRYPRVVYVRTQGALTPGDWDNELHPKKKGFEKIAKIFIASLRQQFPGRI